MSKKSQREKRQQIEDERQQRTAAFSLNLKEWLQAFAEYYRQDVPNETATALYQAGLEHLTPDALNLACKQAIKTCKFYPSVSEILEGLKLWREQNSAGTLLKYEDNAPPSAEDIAAVQPAWDLLRKNLSEMKKSKSFPDQRTAVGPGHPIHIDPPSREPGEEG